MSFLTTTDSGVNLVQQMTIQHDGNVGIGTATPARTLVVEAEGLNTGFIVKSADKNLVVIAGRGSADAAVDKAIFQMFDVDTENIRLDTEGDSWLNGGNVGIGTASPSQKLTVSGNPTNLKILINNTGGEAWDINSASSGLFIIGITNVANYLVIQNRTGNVGIGTTTPATQFEMIGVQAGTGMHIQAGGGAGGRYQLKVENYAGTDSFLVDASGNIFAPNIASSAAANSDMRYDTSNGNIYYQTSCNVLKSFLSIQLALPLQTNHLSFQQK